MVDAQNSLTDPAREIADLLSELMQTDQNKTGDRHLAEKFDVQPWSQDFFRVIATIMDRLHSLKSIIRELPLDDDYKDEMIGHVDEISQVFTPSTFQNNWSAYGADKLSARNLQPLKGLSGLVRQKISYRKLSESELDELLEQVSELTSWLNKHQLSENDFIRQAIIEGLEHLQFRLERFRWLGWGYTLSSLKEVIAAYMLLERQGTNSSSNPDAAVILKKVGEVIKSVYDKIEKTKTVVETADWLLRAYGAASLAQESIPAVSALISPP